MASLCERAAGVAVRNLQVTSRAVLAALKDGEAAKRKHYRAVCWAARPLTAADEGRLNAIKDVEVQQDTPVRVLHRRAPLVRPKVCSWSSSSASCAMGGCCFILSSELSQVLFCAFAGHTQLQMLHFEGAPAVVCS